jgi:hypothetical protein
MVCPEDLLEHHSENLVERIVRVLLALIGRERHRNSPAPGEEDRKKELDVKKQEHHRK